MARKTKHDIAKAKAAKQKKLAIGGGVLLVALLAFQAPKVMKMMNQKPNPPVIAGAATTTPGATPVVPADPNTLAAPTLAGSPTAASPTASSSDLVSAVPVSADPGQLQTFNRFATKDPFAVQASNGGAPAKRSTKPSSSGGGKASGGSSTTPPPVTPGPSGGSGGSTSPAPAAPAPTGATISLNGEAMVVGVGSDFPQSGAVFDRVGAIFHLVSVTAKTAKISIVGGSYADGAAAITLRMGVPLTLQNTADGSKYVFVLKPTPGASSGSGSATPPTTTTPSGGATMSAIVPPAH
ncbi:MAG TPA: hypothetical protein VGK79_10680 [Gaiellaceae bacterium]|jgi:hypothetical protein